VSVLLDTNILLRSAQTGHSLCALANRSVVNLLNNGETVFFCAQNIAEFWNVATRPAALNGLGLSHPEVRKEVQAIEGFLTLLPDNAAIYPESKRLVGDYQVEGVRVHDARLVSIALVFGVKSIMTFNAADFRRYREISVLDPASIAP
jgi:predicted nucleic acid-binding protein